MLGSLFKKVDPQKRAEAVHLFEEATTQARILIFGRRSCPRCVEAEELLSKYTEDVRCFAP